MSKPGESLALLLLVVLVAGPPALAGAPGALTATRITPENVGRLADGGPDAAAGIGDWFLSNGTVCAVVSDPSHESFLSARGGVIIDLSFCDRADDNFVVLQPLLNFSRDESADVTSVRVETGERAARIVTAGDRNGVRVETTYELGFERPEELLITTRLERFADGDRVFVFGDTALHATRQLAPFALSTRDPESSRGYQHPPLDFDNRFEVARALIPADLLVFVGPDTAADGIAYGLWFRRAVLISPDGTARALPTIAITGANFSMMGNFMEPYWFGDADAPGIFELLQSAFMDLDDGDRVEFERSLVVGRRSDVASVTDHVWADAARVSGRVDDPAARIAVRDAEGSPFTTIRPAADGRFSVRLPVGDYRFEAAAPGGRRVTVSHAHGERDTALPPLRLAPPARVALPRGAPMRLSFRGLGGTPDPLFGDDFREVRIGEERHGGSLETRDVSLAGVPADPTEITLAPGRYRVYASRGPEFGVTQTEFEAVAGQTQRLQINAPGRVLETPGWISADLHVHSGRSDDSGLPTEHQLRAFHAQGAEVIVSTEHDRIVDYAPMLRELGLADQIQSIVGVEITSTVRNAETPFTAGHSNAFPLRHRPHEYQGGAPAGEGLRLRRVIATLRAASPTALLQLNHPRSAPNGKSGPDEGAFFSHLSVGEEGLDPTQPLDRGANQSLIDPDPHSGLRDLDFHVIELLNGPQLEAYRLIRADWFSLMLQGEVRPATANSDSHRLSELVGLPRNYIRQPEGDAFDEAALIEAIRAGRLYGTSGPILELSLGGRGPGERFSGTSGVLEISVRAAHWVPVTEVRVYVDGALEETLPAHAGTTLRVPLDFAADGFVTVEVEGPAEGIYAEVAPGHTPFAFSNPIFVDADQDGEWTAPGLPDILPDTIREPLKKPEAR